MLFANDRGPVPSVRSALDESCGRGSRPHRVREYPIVESLDRVTQRPEVMGGRACIRGMRVTVGMIVGMIGAGHSVEDVLAGYPYLEREDVMQALRYAVWLAEEREIVLPSA
ncbi:MAG: DUF433 domain-containing protein [Candidatus Cybelea sp.]